MYLALLFVEVVPNIVFLFAESVGQYRSARIRLSSLYSRSNFTRDAWRRGVIVANVTLMFGNSPPFLRTDPRSRI